MAATVYILPPGLAVSALYGDQFRVASGRAADGSLVGANETAERVPFTVTGLVHGDNHASFEVFRDRMQGGLGLAGLIKLGMRLVFGWDRLPAINSSGDEFWRADGRTSLYAGESAGGTYRSIFAETTAAHSAGDTTVTVDGLLAGEVLPAGCTVRIGDWRYVLAATATADGSGGATLTLARGIRGALAEDAQVRVPGDFMIARMTPGTLRLSETNAAGTANFSAEFREDYADEIVGGIGSYVLP